MNFKKFFTNKKTILIFLLILLIAGYLILTNFIETKWIYPESNNLFNLIIFDYVKNKSCIDFGDTDIIYYNDPNRNHYNLKIKTKNAVSIQSNIKERCDFESARIKIQMNPPNISGEIYSIRDEIEINKTKEGFDMILRDNQSVQSWDIELMIEINESFFNDYIFQSQGGGGINILVFIYRKGIIKGYYADENSFLIMQNLEIDKEYPIERGRKKFYDFNNAQNVTLRFNPKSKGWFLLQKMADAIILGLIVIIIYEFFHRPKINVEKLKYLLENPSTIRGVGKETTKKIRNFLNS